MGLLVVGWAPYILAPKALFHRFFDDVDPLILDLVITLACDYHVPALCRAGWQRYDWSPPAVLHEILHFACTLLITLSRHAVYKSRYIGELYLVYRFPASFFSAVPRIEKTLHSHELS